MMLAIPLHFEANRGQANPATRFTAVTRRYTLELSDTTIAMRFREGSLYLKIPQTKPEGIDEQAAKSNYYFGADPTKWRTAVPNFARVRYANVFRGVDLVVYGREQQVEYDWTVAPGADPRSIHFSFTGASKMFIDVRGDLVFQTRAGDVRHTRPRIFQGNREIAGRFILKGDQVRFEVGDYDRRKPLIIDPLLVVSTSFGGSGIHSTSFYVPTSQDDTGTGIATDSSGNIYITGTTFSINFPLLNSLENAPSTTCISFCAFRAYFVSKFSPDGQTLLYSTYVGASGVTNVLDLDPVQPTSIAIDPSGTVYLAGATSGSNFPGVTATAGGLDAFLLRLDAKGAFLGTMLFGGSSDDLATSVVLGPDGYIYLAGVTSSSNFPVTPGSYQTPSPGGTNAFLIKVAFSSIFGPTTGTVIYSAIVGPTIPEKNVYEAPAVTFVAVAADATGNAYVATPTTSASWPTTKGVVQPACAAAKCGNIVIAKLNATGQQLVYATYLGGSQSETVGGIAVDSSGNAYVDGATQSPDFPVTSGALQTQAAANINKSSGFVVKLTADASKLLYATYLGGSGSDQATAIAIDAMGNAYIGGGTTSHDFPIRAPFNRRSSTRPV